jgi:hypothetical protein
MPTGGGGGCSTSRQRSGCIRTSGRAPRQDTTGMWKVGNSTYSRKYSNIQQGHQQQQQELTIRTFETAAETIGTSQTSTAEGSPSTAEMPEIVELPATVLASVGMPTAQYRHQQLTSFRGNSRKSHQNDEKFFKKDTKKE